jgi:GNAT superfamily N-acetyltransferase
LLEQAFSQEAIDASGMRMIDLLRNYGQFEPMTFGIGTSFVWHEDGRLLGNASIQRNPTRRNTWIIGNVATERAQQGRGIGRAVVDACVRYAVSHGAKFVALQVDRDNERANRLYRSSGFETVGEVNYYMRRSVRQWPVTTDAPLTQDSVIRESRWADREGVWSLARHNISDDLTFSEPFDSAVYKLGLRWSLFNTLNGSPEKWWVLSRGPTGELLGAVRTRVNIEGANHHVELMLREDAGVDLGVALLEHALHRFDNYIARPIYAAQALPHPAAHQALAEVGFTLARHLVHMRLDL